MQAQKARREALRTRASALTPNEVELWAQTLRTEDVHRFAPTLPACLQAFNMRVDDTIRPRGEIVSTSDSSRRLHSNPMSQRGGVNASCSKWSNS